jgi:hypothetical protein
MTVRSASLNTVCAVRMVNWGLTHHRVYIVSGIQVRIQEGRGDFYTDAKHPRPVAVNQLYLMPRLKYVKLYILFPIALGSVQHN